MQHGHALAQLGGGGSGLAEVDATWPRAGTKGGAGLAEVDATCAWARADTTWWVGLTEVDATWTRAGTKGGGAGLTEVDATCAWARADTTWWQGSQKWVQHGHGHVLTQLGGRAHRSGCNMNMGTC